MPRNRGQLSTEYLVILGVVLVTATFLAAQLLGFQMPFASSNEAASKSYWRTAEIGVLNYRIYDSGEAEFAIKNNVGNKIRLMEFNVGGSNIISNPNGILIPVGGTTVVSGNVPPGNGPYSFDLDFKYEVLT